MSNIKLPPDIVPLLKWKIDVNNTNANGILLINDKEELAVITTGWYNQGRTLRSFKKYVVDQQQMQEFARLHTLQTTFNNDLNTILNGED